MSTSEGEEDRGVRAEVVCINQSTELRAVEKNIKIMFIGVVGITRQQLITRITTIVKQNTYPQTGKFNMFNLNMFNFHITEKRMEDEHG